jgi:hypothetical protein
MKGHINIKSAAIGAAVVVSLLLVTGAVGGRGSLPVIGRFQIACTDSICYLVDTATGQVWMTGDRDFREPKLKAPEPVMTGQAAAFVGHWASDDPEEEDLRIRLEPDGTAVASEDNDRRYEGHWRVEGARVVITIEDETITGELQPDGRLLLWEQGDEDERIMFKRVP